MRDHYVLNFVLANSGGQEISSFSFGDSCPPIPNVGESVTLYDEKEETYVDYNITARSFSYEEAPEGTGRRNEVTIYLYVREAGEEHESKE